MKTSTTRSMTWSRSDVAGRFLQAGREGCKETLHQRPESESAGSLELLKEDPFATPPRYERLVGNLAGMYSRRISIQHRLVYEVFEEEHTVRVLRMWTHYE